MHIRDVLAAVARIGTRRSVAVGLTGLVTGKEFTRAVNDASRAKSEAEQQEARGAAKRAADAGKTHS